MFEEFGLVCDGTGPLLNRTCGAGCREQSAFGAITETAAKRRAESAKRPRVLNLDEAAKRYSTTRRNVERLNAAGEGPRLVQVSAREVGAFLRRISSRGCGRAAARVLGKEARGQGGTP